MSATDEKDYASFPQTKDVVDLNFYNTSHEKIKEAYKNEAKSHDKVRNAIESVCDHWCI